ncbi:MAG: hypothetical protein P4L40_02615 [Terracidiphilus sp.]|nr:hypothetical protein [Terracidiphilus sp.]
MSVGGLVVPATVQSCPPCSLCDTTQCSGHGRCSASEGCVCVSGYTGKFCEQPAACEGPVDGRGACCPKGAFLDGAYECCDTALDNAGLCCASNRLNACGVCDGPATALVSTVGQCCPSGVLDAGGLCCNSGVLDSFGVCDGIDATGMQTLSVQVESVSGSVNTTSTAAVLQGYIATSLNRSADSVVVVLSQQQLRRVQTESRALASTQFPATVVLHPYGGSNNAPASLLQALLVNATETQAVGVGVSAVTDVKVSAICGNGVCEAGERPDSVHATLGCPADCQYPVPVCPVANGAFCNNTGVCVVGVSGVGRCVCWTGQGYTGEACTECVPGYTRSPSGQCVVLEVPNNYVAPSRSPTPSSSHGASPSGSPVAAAGIVPTHTSSNAGVIAAAVVMTVAFVCCIGVASVVIRRRRRGRPVHSKRIAPADNLNPQKVCVYVCVCVCCVDGVGDRTCLDCASCDLIVVTVLCHSMCACRRPRM